MSNKQYRHGLVSAQIEVDLPLQIRALRKQLVGTQPELSKLTGMKQSRISAMEKPGKVSFNIETLRRLAEAFDVALIVRFAPFSELLEWSDNFSPDAFRVPNFEEELKQFQMPVGKYSTNSLGSFYSMPLVRKPVSIAPSAAGFRTGELVANSDIRMMPGVHRLHGFQVRSGPNDIKRGVLNSMPAYFIAESSKEPQYADRPR